MTTISHHPLIFASLLGLQLLISLIDILGTAFHESEGGKLPAWGYLVYHTLNPALVLLINIPLALGLCCTLDNASVIEPIKSLVPWFIFFWILSYSFLNLFAFAMFFDAFRLFYLSGGEMLKTIPNFLFKQYPTVVIIAFYVSLVCTTIVMIIEGSLVIARYLISG